MGEQWAEGGLGRRVLHSAAYLSFRHIFGLVLSVVGMVVVARLVGPTAYGTYAIAAGIYGVLISVGQLGVSPCLIRMRKEPEQRDFDAAFTFLAAIGLALWIASSAIAAALPYWTTAMGIREVAFVVFGMIVPQLVIVVPGAMLERRLDYRSIARIELGAQIVFQSVAIIAAVSGYGVWAPVIASWVHIIIASIAMFGVARYRPRLCWDGNAFREFTAFGIPYIAWTSTWQLRLLINSLVVGHFAGAETAGVVAICIRIVDALASAKAVALRIAFPALGSVHADIARTARMIGEGAQLQVFALAPPLLVFALIGPGLLGLILGRNWLPVAQVFPFIATAALIQAVYGLQSTALAVHGRNWSAAAFSGVYVAIFFVASVALVPMFGLRGYGLSEMIALPSYAWLQQLCARTIPGVRLAPSLAWALGIAVALFWREFGLWILAAAATPLLLPQAREALEACWLRARSLVVREG